MRITGRRTPFRVSDTRRSTLSQAGRILPGYPAHQPRPRASSDAPIAGVRATDPGLVCETRRHACTQVTTLLS